MSELGGSRERVGCGGGGSCGTASAAGISCTGFRQVGGEHDLVLSQMRGLRPGGTARDQCCVGSHLSSGLFHGPLDRNGEIRLHAQVCFLQGISGSANARDNRELKRAITATDPKTCVRENAGAIPKRKIRGGARYL